eukprot:gb/GECG01006923.1/.p1 GENE.gb/GECG01006923.1/~~gb/GECG01006923.1/.p1  ORF type:complete len:250 (+),score=37.10 gb/GECG01006923.1/:1-750(+)
MSSSQGGRTVTYVYYFIPGDGDTEEHPNVFPIPKALKSITVQDIRQHFPLPGSYFFRFKQEHGKGHVWLDNQDPSERAPIYSGRIFCKVARLSFEDARMDSANLNEASTPIESTPTPSPVSAGADRNNASQSLATGEKSQSSGGQANQSRPSKQEEHGGDLLGMGGSSNAAANGKQNTAKQQRQDVDDLVDIDTKRTASRGGTTSGMAEFEGLDFGEKTSPNRNQGYKGKSNPAKTKGEDLEENIFGWV